MSHIRSTESYRNPSEDEQEEQTEEQQPDVSNQQQQQQLDDLGEPNTDGWFGNLATFVRTGITSLSSSNPVLPHWARDPNDINDRGSITTTLYDGDTPETSEDSQQVAQDVAGGVDPGNTEATTEWLSSLHTDDAARTEFVENLPAIIDELTPEQMALVGEVFMQSGAAFEDAWGGSWDEMNADPEFQQMAELYRAWGDETSRRGVDPLGNEIEVAVSSTGEDWRAHEGVTSMMTDMDGVHSDMNLPYSMWTEEGNLNRYASAEEVWFIHGDPEAGTRPIGRPQDNAHERNVTMQELEVANGAAVWVPDSDGNLVLVDASEGNQLNVDLSMAAEGADLPEVFGVDLDETTNPQLFFEDGQIWMDEVTNSSGTSHQWNEDGSLSLEYLRQQVHASGISNSTSATGTVGANQQTATISTGSTDQQGNGQQLDWTLGFENGHFMAGTQITNSHTDTDGNTTSGSGGGAVRFGPGGVPVGVDVNAGLQRNGMGATFFAGASEHTYTVFDSGSDQIGVGTNADFHAGGGGTATAGPVTVGAEGYVTRGQTTEYTTNPENLPGMEEAIASGDSDRVNEILAESYLTERSEAITDARGGQDFSTWNAGDRMRASTREGWGARGSLGLFGVTGSLGRDDMTNETLEYEMLEDNQLAVSVLNMNDTAFNATLTGGPFAIAAQIAEGNATGTSFTVDLDSTQGQARMDAFEATGLLPGAIDLYSANEGVELPIEVDDFVAAANLLLPDGAEPLTEPDWSNPVFVEAVMNNEEAVAALSTVAGEANSYFLARPDEALEVDGVTYEDIVTSRTRSRSTSLSVLGATALQGVHSEEFTERYYRVDDDFEANFLYDQFDSWMFSSDSHTVSTSINGETGAYLETNMTRNPDYDVFQQVSDAAVDTGVTNLYDHLEGDLPDHVGDDSRMIFSVALAEEDVGLIDTVLENSPDAAERRADWVEGVDGNIQGFLLDHDLATMDSEGNLVLNAGEVGELSDQYGYGTTEFAEDGSIANAGLVTNGTLTLLEEAGFSPEQAELYLVEQWNSYDGPIEDMDVWCAQTLVDVSNVRPEDLGADGELDDFTRSMFVTSVSAAYDHGNLADAPVHERFEMIDLIWDFDDPELRDRHMRQLFYDVERQQSGGESPLEFYTFLQTLPPEVSGYLTQGANAEITRDMNGGWGGLHAMSESLGDWYGGHTSHFYMRDEFAEMDAEGDQYLLDAIAESDVSAAHQAWIEDHPNQPFPWPEANALELLIPSFTNSTDSILFLETVQGTTHWESTYAFLEQNPDALFHNLGEYEIEFLIQEMDAVGMDGSAIYEAWASS